MYVWSTNAAVMLEEKVIGDVSSQDIQVHWICAALPGLVDTAHYLGMISG